MTGLVADLRYAARRLRRSPGLVAAATLSLGLGIGVNTTLYSAAKALLFEEPTAQRGAGLVRLQIDGSPAIPRADLRRIRDSGVLEDAAGYRLSQLSARAGREAEKIVGEVVTANYFDVLGVRPAIGRMFGRGGAEPPGVVVSDGYWRRRLDSAPDVIGRPLTINGQRFTIAGLLPPGFRSIEGFGLAPEMYVPASAEDERPMRVLGRLKEGSTRVEAQAALAAVAPRRVIQVFGVSAMERLRETQGGIPAMAMAGLLAAITGLVLLIACGNVAGLQLARGADRRREIAMRLALGASRGRIVRQLLMESLLLAVAGAGCGWLLHLWTVAFAAGFRPGASLPLPLEFNLDQGARLLPVELALAAVATLLCGLMPAIETTRVALVPALKQAPNAIAGRLSRRGTRVVLQVAASMLQLVIAALFLRALTGAVHLSPGFDAERVVAAEIHLDDSRFSRERGLAYLDEAIARVRALPGVESVSAANRVPFDWNSVTAEVDAAGQAKVSYVAPEYFRTMGIALARGRDFDSRDRADAPRVAIASAEFARRFFSGSDALGRRVRVDGRMVEIAGIARDSKYATLGEAAQPVLYRPFAQEYGMGLVLVARTAGPPAALAGSIRRELAGIAADVPVAVRPLAETIELSLAPNRAGAVALGTMGALGMGLALTGLYGVMSYSVARRTSEIGVRIALGASPRMVLRGVLRHGLALAGSGIAVGAAAALALAPQFAMFLGGVSPHDPVSLLAPAALLAAAALAASYVPARRAMRVEPATALRCE